MREREREERERRERKRGECIRIKDMERLKAKIAHISLQGNEDLILKKEAEIVVLDIVVSMASDVTNVEETKEEVSTMQVLSKLEHLLFLK